MSLWNTWDKIREAILHHLDFESGRMSIIAGQASDGSDDAVVVAVDKTTGAVKTGGTGTQDATASTDFTVAGAELVDPASLPADGIAGRVRRVLATLKGVLLTWRADRGAGEDILADRQLVEEEWELWSSTTEGQVKASPGKLGHIHITCGTAGTVTLYNNAGETGDVIDTFTFAAAGDQKQAFYYPFDAALYCGFDGTFAGRVTVLYR